MPTMFHLNHGLRNCPEGHVLNLIPIDVPQDAEFAEDYDGWRTAFPAGLSLFGLRHVTLLPNFGPMPESKLRLEFECERVRQERFRGIRSRFQSFFCLETIADARAFQRHAAEETGIIGEIWEVEIQQVHHRGDMNLLSSDNFTEADLISYWQGLPRRRDENPLWEHLVIPPVTMIRRVVCVE